MLVSICSADCSAVKNQLGSMAVKETSEKPFKKGVISKFTKLLNRFQQNWERLFGGLKKD